MKCVLLQDTQNESSQINRAGFSRGLTYLPRARVQGEKGHDEESGPEKQRNGQLRPVRSAVMVSLVVEEAAAVGSCSCLL